MSDVVTAPVQLIVDGQSKDLPIVTATEGNDGIVVSNHGGEVTLWSQPGQGSTFTLRLPEMEGPDVGEEPAAGPKSAPPKHHAARQSHESRAAGAHEQGASA